MRVMPVDVLRRLALRFRGPVHVCVPAQVGFIEFVVAPLYAVLLEIFPGMTPGVTNMCANRDAYARGHVKQSRVSC